MSFILEVMQAVWLDILLVLQEHSEPALPDWAPGHHVTTASRDADMDRHIRTDDASWTEQDRHTDWGFDHPLTLPDYPINNIWEEHTEEDTSTGTDESSFGDESLVPGVAAAHLSLPGDAAADQPQRKTTPREAADRQDSTHTAALSDRKQEEGDQEQEGSSAGTVLLALLVALLAFALAGGLAYTGWREYKRRQVPFMH
jgi:hypothetical protein